MTNLPPTTSTLENIPSVEINANESIPNRKLMYKKKRSMVKNIPVKMTHEISLRKYSHIMTPGLISEAVIPNTTSGTPSKILRSASAAEMTNVKSFLAYGNVLNRSQIMRDEEGSLNTQELRRKSIPSNTEEKLNYSRLTKESSYNSLAQLKEQKLKLPSIRNLQGVASMPSMPSIDSIKGSQTNFINLEASYLQDQTNDHYLTTNPSLDQINKMKHNYSSVNLINQNSERKNHHMSSASKLHTSLSNKKKGLLKKNLHVHQSAKVLDPSAKYMAQYRSQDAMDIVKKYSSESDEGIETSKVVSTNADTKANENSYIPLPQITKFSRLSEVISQKSESSEEHQMYKTDLNASTATLKASREAYRSENVKWDTFKDQYADLNIRAAKAKEGMKHKSRLISLLSEFGEKKQVNQAPIIGDKYEQKLTKVSPYLDSIYKRRMAHKEFKEAKEEPNESLYVKHQDKNLVKYAMQKRKQNDQDLSDYFGAKPSYERYKIIKKKQDKIQQTKVEEDPEKTFIHRNIKELEDHFHVKHGVKNRIPLKEQGIQKQDTDPIGYTLDKKPSVKKIWDRQVDDKIGLKDMFHLLDKMFAPFSGKEFRSQKLKHDLVHQRTVFYAKLTQMSQEFDEAVGARLAHLLFYQNCQQNARKERIQKFESLGHPGIAKGEKDELNYKEGTVFLDDLMQLDELDQVSKDNKNAQVKFRVTKIAEHCKKFLTELKVFPKNYKDFFSSEKIAKAHKSDQGYKTAEEYERLMQQIHDKPFMLRPSDEQLNSLKNDPHRAGDRKNIVQIGGLEFYINHFTKECIPLDSLVYMDQHSPIRELGTSKGFNNTKSSVKSLSRKATKHDLEKSQISFGSPNQRNLPDNVSQVTWQDIQPSVIEASFIP